MSLPDHDHGAGDDSGSGAAERARVSALLARHGYPVRSMRVLGAGLDHVAYDVDGRFVARVARGADDAERARREARLLGRLAAASPLPVPAPELIDDAGEAACLVYPRLPGTPLLDVPLLDVPAGPHGAAGVPTPVATRVGRALGGLLAVLHAEPVERWADVVAPDDAAPAAWLPDAAEAYAAAVSHVPPEHRRSVETFLGAEPPPRASRLALCHGDLGIEHVLVDARARVVTGVVDWSDAALADPARDLGLVYRDLGRAGLQAALDARGCATGDDAGLAERVVFYARCGALEDLAFGLATGRRAYAAKSLAGLGRLFAAGRAT